MPKLTRLLAGFSFLAFTAMLLGCGRSDLIDYAGSYGTLTDGGTRHDARTDAPTTGCTSSEDCGSTPATPYCELPPGVCVACLTNPDTCPSGEACDPTTHTCIPLPGGCTSNAQCPASKPVCDLATGICVGCLTNAECPLGEICQNFECVGFCGGGAPCGPGLACCSPACVDEGTDPKNCGGCGLACPAGEACLGGACQPPAGCQTTGCTPGDLCCGETCVNTSVSPINCGGCGVRCPPGDTCDLGSCVSPASCSGNFMCHPPAQCCSAACTNTQSDPNNCGGCGVVCPPSSVCEASTCIPISTTCNGGPPCSGVDTCCPGGCTDTNTDPNNCSGCGFVCPEGSTCSGGNCTPQMSCNGGPVCVGVEQCCQTGCTDIDTDPNNCGGCGQRCPPGATCAGGLCQRPASCNGGPVCVGVEQCCKTGCANIDTDPNNCGQCGNPCPPGDTCVGAVCQAPASCNGGPVCVGVEQCCATGCTDVDTDPNNCGQCGLACAPGDSCNGGVCQAGKTCNGGPVCPPGEQCCLSGCSNTLADPNNCGSCGNACAAGSTCVMGICSMPVSCNGGPACPPGDTCCPSGCLATTNDPNNCGGCGVVCGTGDTCVGSTCTSNEGVFNPTVNPTYLSPGPHSFTSINIPAGITVYVAGAGANSGTLNLSATGTIIVAGTIDVSGGPGTQNTITSQNTQAGEAGGGGYTGEPYASAAGSAACSFVAGNGGSLGDAVAGTAGSCPVASTTVCILQSNPASLLFAAPPATYGGGGGIFTGYRAYGAGGGGPAGGAPGGLGAAYPGEGDCSGASGGGGAVNGQGGAGTGPYAGSAGKVGQTQCPGLQAGVPPAYVGGGGGGSIGAAAVADLTVGSTFQTGSAGGGGSADYLNRPVFGGTSGGGGGGGALKLSSGTSITITGAVLANGGLGGDAVIGIGSDANCDPQPGAAGGGGSGGVIYLSAPVVSVPSGATVSAAGGSGGAGSEFATGGAGGRGGVGRIRLSVGAPSCSTLSGSFTPALPAGCAAGPATPGVTYIATYPN